MKRPRFFYGWVIVAAGFVIQFVVGAIVYNFGAIFFSSLQQELDVSRGLISTIALFFLLPGAIGAFTMGRLSDKYGPRRAILGCALFIGVGCILCSQIHSLWQAYLPYALVGFGMAGCGAPVTSTVQRWFVKRRGMVLGIVVAATGVGTLVFAPAANYLVDAYGWRMAYVILGVVFLVALTLAAWVMESSPEKRGLRPYGAEEMDRASPADDTRVGAAPGLGGGEGWTTGDALRTRAFYISAAICLFSFVPTQMLAWHIIVFAGDVGISAATAAGALGALGGASIVGRLAGGPLADRVGWRKAIALLSFPAAAAWLWLMTISDVGMLYGFTITFGLLFGARSPQIPGLVGFLFGTTSLGELIGITNAIGAGGAIFGPLIAGGIYDATGSYSIAFLIGALCLAIAGTLALFVKPPQRALQSAVVS